jgi:site-specific DNA recombinase
VTKVIGYARVSSLDQVDNYSLDAQRHSIEKYSQNNGYELIDVYVDEGASAFSDNLRKRPSFRKAIDLVVAGGADAIIVDKSDRFARNAKVFHDVLDQLKNRVIFVRDGFDLTTPGGEMMAGMMALMSQFFSRNLGEETRKGKTERVRQGLYLGELPYGYRKQDGDEHGKLAPVVDQTPILCTLADRQEWSPETVVRHIFASAGSGFTRRDITRQLDEIGFDLSRGLINSILRNRFYLGELTYAERLGCSPRGVQPVLIDEDTFDAATRAAKRNQRGTAVVRSGARPSALTGLVTCGRCGGSMHSMRDKGTTRLLCSGRSSKGSCDQVSVAMQKIEERVIEVLTSFAPPREVALRLAEAVNAEQSPSGSDVSATKGREKRLRDLYEWETISKEEFDTKMSEIHEARSEIQSRQVEVDTAALSDMLENLGATYEAADEPTRNELAKKVFTGLLIDDQELVSFRFLPALNRLMRAWSVDLEGGCSWRCPVGRRRRTW